EEDTGRALLTDFGIARVEHVATSSLTAPGMAIGTPDYMAPEQAAGSERLDGRADLYSLALVAFEALTGTRPALGTERAALARALCAARPELSGAAAAALVAPLALRRDDRPASAAAWLAAVGRGAAGGWRRRRRWAWYLRQTNTEFAKSRVTLAARLYEVGQKRERSRAQASGSADSVSDLMDRVWAQILGHGFVPKTYPTLPSGNKDAIAAYLNAEYAFRRGDYLSARAEYT